MRALLRRVHPEDRGPLLQGLRGVLEGSRRSALASLRLRDASGDWRWIDHCALARDTTAPSGERSLELIVLDASSRVQELAAARRQVEALSSHLALAEERERRRVAEDLHDDVGQLLAAFRVRLGGLAKSLEASGDGTRLGEAGELIALLDQAIQRTRRLAFDLSSPVLERIGLEAALRSFARQAAADHAIDITVGSQGEPWEPDRHARTLLFRSVRELVQNALKHARAESIDIHLYHRADHIELTVRDDGVGFEPDLLGEDVGESGFGLLSVRSALAHFGGTFELRSRPGSGTQVRLRLDREAAAEVAPR